MKRLLTSLAMSLVLMTTGCATMLGGGHSNLHVNVDEPRQDVEVRIQGANGELITQRSSDFRVTLSRGTDYTIKIRSPQYETEEVLLRRNLRGAFWANGLLLLLGVVPGLVGFGVDFVTNNAWEHEKSQLNIRLEKARRTSDGRWVVPVHLSGSDGSTMIEAPVEQALAAR